MQTDMYIQQREMKGQERRWKYRNMGIELYAVGVAIRELFL